MFTLTQGIWEQFFRKKDYFVVIVGLDNAGKTTFLEQTKAKFIKNYGMVNPAKITSTVGLNIGKIELGNSRLNFWDLGGQDELRSLWDKYFDEAHALIFVLDASNRDTFPLVQRIFGEVLSNPSVQAIPVLVICNKSELEDSATVEEIGRALSDDHGHHADLAMLPVSALEGLNVDRCVRWLVRALSSSGRRS